MQPVQDETRVQIIRPHRLRARQVKPVQPGFEPKPQREERRPAPMRRAVSKAGEERGWRLAQRVGTLKAFRGRLGVP